MAQRLTLAFCLAVSAGRLKAEMPGEFRPQPTLDPAEHAGATGTNVQPRNTYPVSHAPLVNTAQSVPKLASPGEPFVRGNELVFNSGWEMIEAPRVKSSDGPVLSRPGVDNYFSLLPGESRRFRIESSSTELEACVTVDGWNLEPTAFQ